MKYTLPTTLNNHNVAASLEEIQHSLAQDINPLIVDAGQVQQIDSAGMALLLELRQLNNLQLEDLSPSILKVAELYHLDLLGSPR